MGCIRVECKRYKYSGSVFSTASPGAVLRTVQAVPQLSKLYIMHVSIALTELVGVLKTGKRLREVETSLGDQEEAPFERVEVRLLMAAECNNGLRSFFVEDIKHERGPIPVNELKQQARRVLTGLRFLEKCAAYVWIKKLEEDIEAMAVFEQFTYPLLRNIFMDWLQAGFESAWKSR